MFTWIQKYFQRHFGLICVIILGAMGIPLIVVFAPSDGIGQGDQKAFQHEVFGYNLGSERDKAQLFGDANLSATLQLGYSGVSGEQLQQYALQRAAAIHLANEHHIPATTNQEVSDQIKTLRIFANENGTFDAKRYASFRESLKAGARFTEADVSRVIADDVRADKMRKVLAGPGYVLDADVKTQLEKSETTWTLAVANIDYEKFTPVIEPSSDELAKYFGDNSFRYEIGPRVKATYIAFPATKYSEQFTTNDDELKAFFEASPARFQKPATDDQPAAPATSGDFEIVKDLVLAELKIAKGRQIALKEAADLTLALYESKLSNTPESLVPFLEAHHKEQLPLEPFTQAEGPAEFGRSQEVTTAAFRLNEQRFYSDAVPVQTGAVVLLWKETLPTRIPLMTEVLEKVTVDYTEGEKRKQFVELGTKLKASIKDRLAAGDDFATAAQTARDSLGVSLEVKSLSPFTASNPPAASEFATFGPLETLSKGEVSDMVITRENGSLVYAADKQLPNLSMDNPKYEETRKQIAFMTARLGANKYLDEIVQKELAKADSR